MTATNGNIEVSRTDSLAGSRLSSELFATWEAAFESLRTRGIPLTSDHEIEFRAHPDTQFSNEEFLNNGSAAYSCNVQYDVRVIQ